MNPLVEKIRKSRQRETKVGKFTFLIRRPTIHEYLQYQKSGGKIHIPVEDLRKFVMGWPGMTEMDIWPGGIGAEVQFDADVFQEWVADHPKIWSALLNEILVLFNDYISARDDIAKN